MIITQLLKAGADLEAQDNYGRTALIIATNGACHEVIELLLKTGAENY